MKKNKYNFPRYATNSNNTQYNRWVEEEYFRDEPQQPVRGDEANRKERRKPEEGHLYFDPMASDDYQEDPYTVAQHFEDRTERPNG